ncbi:helix-turn-helix transcriptional regulator [Paenibacillus sp. LX16]|uniref:helix-turn-helix domain-containing protein n=1 Tax=Paenibacillus sp. LX16 TaxID=1740264 RepID=UPI002E284774|nr:helix-turn-helix transcriptional regulator [Paenibacillus sp. LX16]
MESTRIRKIRRERDLSGTEIAEKLGISAQYYYDIERGKRNLSPNMARKLANILSVKPEYLLGDLEETVKQEESEPDNINDDYYKIERFARKVSPKDRKKAITILEAAFEDAFDEDDEDDDNI